MVINKLHKLKLDGAELLSYADDLAIVVRGRTKAFNKAQKALEVVQLKCRSLGLKISPEKTKAISYHRKAPLHGLMLEGQELGWGSQVRYLGITFDKRLTFKPHVLDLRNRMSLRANIMRSISKTTWGANPANMALFYQQAIVAFGSFHVGPCSGTEKPFG